MTVIGQAKPTGASLDWWSSETGVPEALQRAGAWGSVGASMTSWSATEQLRCFRDAVDVLEILGYLLNSRASMWHVVSRVGWASPSRLGNVVICQLKPPHPMPQHYKGAEAERWLKGTLESVMSVPNRTGRELAVILERAYCKTPEEVCKALQMALQVGCCSVGTMRGSAKNPRSTLR